MFLDHSGRVIHFIHYTVALHFHYCIHCTILLFMYLSLPLDCVSFKGKIHVLLIIFLAPNWALRIHEGLSKYLLIRDWMNNIFKRNTKPNNSINYCWSIHTWDQMHIQVICIHEFHERSFKYPLTCTLQISVWLLVVVRSQGPYIL